jgi:hypothetical protein
MGRQGQHQSFYKKASWLKRSRYQLRIEPLCRMCAQEGRVNDRRSYSAASKGQNITTVTFG